MAELGMTELEKWRNRIEHGRRLRTAWRRRYKVRELTEQFYGKETFLDDDDEKEEVNRFWPTIKSLLPSLFFRNPTYRVVAVDQDGSPAHAMRAAMDEAILTSIAKQENQLERAVRLAIPQSMFSIAVLKVTYEPRMEKNPQAGEVMTRTTASGEPIIDPDTNEPMVMLDPDTGEPMEEPNEILTDEVYGYSWVNANNMILPDDGPDMKKWTWIAEEITVPLSQAKKDTRISSSFRRLLQANSKRANFDEEGFMDEMVPFFPEQQDLAMERVTYTEIWDQENKRHYAIIDGQPFSDGDFLFDRDFPDGIEDNPYAILLGYTHIIEPRPLPWPLPHTRNWLGPQKEYSLRRLQIMEGAKRTIRKVYYDDSTFVDEDAAVAGLQSSKDMEAIHVRNVDKRPVVEGDTSLSNSIAQDLAFLDRDWIRITGSPGARIGDTRTDTATEASLEFQSAEIRDTDMRHLVNQWLAEAGKKMRKLVRATLTNGMYIKMRGFDDNEFQLYIQRVYGDEFFNALRQSPNAEQIFRERLGEEKTAFVTGEDLAFDADVEVVPGSSRPRSLQAERQQILNFLTILGQFPQLALSRELMRTLGNTYDFISEGLIDELHALARQMVDIQARQAGRFQGGDNAQNVARQG